VSRVPAPRSPVPAPSLDRAALERVLARAAELQSHDAAEPGHSLTDEQIVELGKEVGLTPTAIRQALAEERARTVVPEARGLLGSFYGPPVVSAARVIAGNADTMLATLDTVMRSELSFDVSRRFTNRMQWMPKRGFFDVMRQFTRGGEGIDLRVTEEVAASVLSIDAEQQHVRLDATLGAERRGATIRASLATATALGAALIVAITGAPVLLAVPVFAGGSALGLAQTRATYRRHVLRVSRGLEQLLDRLEFGPASRRQNLVDKLFG
jgi:hypothetical protein